MTDKRDPAAEFISALDNIIDKPPAGAPQFACDEHTLRVIDRMAERIDSAVVHVLLIGNPEHPSTRRYFEIYRNAGCKVTIEDSRRTCAIGGKTFHTIAVDELESRIDGGWQLRHAIDEVERSIIKRAATDLVNEYLPQILKPKNLPHGPQRKGRGGKTRKW